MIYVSEKDKMLLKNEESDDQMMIFVAFCSLLIWVCSFVSFGPIDNANSLSFYVLVFIYHDLFKVFDTILSLFIFGIDFEFSIYQKYCWILVYVKVYHISNNC